MQTKYGDRPGITLDAEAGERMAKEVSHDPCASFALKETLAAWLKRDCVDAANDAEVLAMILRARCAARGRS